MILSSIISMKNQRSSAQTNSLMTIKTWISHQPAALIPTNMQSPFSVQVNNLTLQRTSTLIQQVSIPQEVRLNFLEIVPIAFILEGNTKKMKDIMKVMKMKIMLTMITQMLSHSRTLVQWGLSFSRRLTRKWRNREKNR